MTVICGCMKKPRRSMSGNSSKRTKAPLSKGAAENCAAIYRRGIRGTQCEFAETLSESATACCESLHHFVVPLPLTREALEETYGL